MSSKVETLTIKPNIMITYCLTVFPLTPNIVHVTIRFPIGNFLSVFPRNQTSISSGSELFNGECDAMNDMTLNDL